MSTIVRSMLRTFDQLTVREQTDFATSFLRRLAALDWPALTDKQLVQVADEAFLRMDNDEERRRFT